jgi:hypothetical protein
MKAYEGVELLLHSILTSALDASGQMCAPDGLSSGKESLVLSGLRAGHLRMNVFYVSFDTSAIIFL